MFCYKVENAKNMVFNKQSTESRITEIKSEYSKLCGEWSPRQTNGQELYKKTDYDWSKVDMAEFKTIGWSESWKDMPKAAINYLKSLPEFNAKIFKRITNIDATVTI